jgi:hypothetical protein
MREPKLSGAFGEYQRAEKKRAKARLVDGRPYHEYAAEVKAMVKAGDLDEAAGVLLRLLPAIEAEARIPLAGHVQVPAWYFRQLATIYRKRGMVADAEKVMLRFQVASAKAGAGGLAALESLRATAHG